MGRAHAGHPSNVPSPLEIEILHAVSQTVSGADGYAILLGMAKGRYTPMATFYSALGRLIDMGWVTPSYPRSRGGDHTGRTYLINDMGKLALAAGREHYFYLARQCEAALQPRNIHCRECDHSLLQHGPLALGQFCTLEDCDCEGFEAK